MKLAKLTELAMLPTATALHLTCRIGLLVSLPVVFAQAVLFDLCDEIAAVLVARVRTAFDTDTDTDIDTGTETETLEMAA